MDAPPTPGEWSYRATPGGSAAYYGPPESEAVFAISCSPEARIVELTAPGDSPPTVQIVVRTETRQATLNGQQSGELPSVRTTLPASDPLLDAMAFSKGRFAVQIGGLRTLYIPAYPEVTRVIEDCR